MISPLPRLYRIFILLAISSVFLVACSGEESGGTSHTFSVSVHAENSLMVDAVVTTENNATVFIQFEADNLSVRQTATSELGTEHRFVVVGLRAETSYQFVAVITDENDNITESDSKTLATGSLPVDAPTVELLTNTENSVGGITFFAESDAATTSRFYGVDEEGVPVWYLHGDDIPMSASPVIRPLDGGRLMLMLTREVRIIDITGETLASYPLPAYHHDAILLDSGNLMAITYQTETINGQSVKGDRIVEVDAEGNTVWEWSTFDHLDTGRFPGALSTRSNNGALDWTHSNAIFHLPHDDTILLSSRSQSWVINIDHSTGDIVWIMGSDEGAADNLQNKFLTLLGGSWMASQHAPMLTGTGDILIYDNRNEAELPGSLHNSRAVRYSLNTSEMTAVQSWEHISPKYTQSLGDVDELANGNVLMTSGGPGSSNDARILEVAPDASGSVLWEIVVPGTSIYRAERIRWEDVLKTTVRAVNDASTGDSAPISDLIDIANCQEAAHFIDTNNVDNYIDFDLNGNTNADLFGEELAPVLSVSCDESTLFINSNGATNFDWINLGAGAAAPIAVDYNWTLPRNPTLTNEQVSLPLLGPVAITVTGIKIFGPNENAADNYANPVTDGLLNYCGGHTRDYHFHERAKCFFEWPTLGGAASLLPSNTAGVVIGYALDGFPILAPWECSDSICTEIYKVESSYAYIGTGDYANENAWQFHSYQENLSPLDQCNGMTRPDGSYAYYATDGWPYYLACYKGPTHLLSDNNRLVMP